MLSNIAEIFSIKPPLMKIERMMYQCFSGFGVRKVCKILWGIGETPKVNVYTLALLAFNQVHRKKSIYV